MSRGPSDPGSTNTVLYCTNTLVMIHLTQESHGRKSSVSAWKSSPPQVTSISGLGIFFRLEDLGRSYVVCSIRLSLRLAKIHPTSR
jgi:hypothetical protein